MSVSQGSVRIKVTPHEKLIGILVSNQKMFATITTIILVMIVVLIKYKV